MNRRKITEWLLRAIPRAAVAFGFLLAWIYLAVMFEETIHDDFDQRPGLLIIAPRWMQVLVYAVLPAVVIVAGALAAWSKRRSRKLIFGTAAAVALEAWVYVAMVLPEDVLGREVAIEARHRPVYYTVGFSDFVPFILINLAVIVCMRLLWMCRPRKAEPHSASMRSRT